MTQQKVPFSERHGYVRKAIQIESMDAPLRNGLWNAFSRHAWIDSYTYDETRLMETFCKKLWVEHFKETEDAFRDLSKHSLGTNWSIVRRTIKEQFEDSDWHKVYDFLEFVGNHSPHRPGSFIKECDLVFERECAGYKFVKGLIVPITNDLEIEEIEAAIEGQKEPADHLRDAVKMLSDRRAPNYGGSLEESIKAVESQSRKTFNSTDTLGQLVSRLTKELGLPKPLTTGLSKITAMRQTKYGMAG